MMVSRGLFGWSPPHIQPLTPVSEVSEPPESPSPYLDTTAEAAGEAAQVEAEEEMEEEEEIEPPPAAVPFSGLFACADRLDWVLMIVGSLAAAAHGTALVVYLHYFAKIIQVLGLGPQEQGQDRMDEQFERFKEVANTMKRAVLLVLHIRLGLFGYRMVVLGYLWIVVYYLTPN